MKKLHLALCAMGLLAVTPPLAASEQDRVNRAADIVEHFRAMPDKGIPRRVLRDAKGVAIITVLKGGFIWSGRIGEGVVLARTGSGWSGPSFIRTGGAGFGLQIGGKVTEFVIVLNTREAVNAFAHGGNVELSGALSAVAGPVGRTAESGVLPKAAVYTYSQSQGLFAGVSLEGTVLVTNDVANARYYGGPVRPQTILAGLVMPPSGAGRLLHAL
ncbi:MAG: lipid-binding SYLF domain-containing protein [Chthoniobacteraceae bacterium]